LNLEERLSGEPKPIDIMGIHEFFYPRGVAVVGSAAEGKIGYELIKQILGGGYPQVFAVNPKAQGALGIPGYQTACQIKQPVDVAVIASPAATVPSVLEDCGQAGIKSIVIISAGFSEVGNHAGEEDIRQVARKYGMRVVGPNCAGIINTHHKLFASLETRPPRGEVAFISQSGALGGAVLSWAKEQGLGFGKFVSYGNRLDLDEIDLLPYLAQDEETKVAALYIESVADGQAFMQSVLEFTRHKPLVVIKSGRSQSGQRATLSHTGSMAGTDAVYDAALRACGAIRVDSVEDMFDLCKGFISLPPVKGRRVAIVTNSGGPGVLAADGAERVGLRVSEPSSGLRRRLSQFLPTYGALRNPIDLTVEGTEASYREALCATLEEEYDAALALDVSTPYLNSVALARGVADAARKSGKPVAVCFMAGSVVAKAIAYLKKRGFANFPTGERAMSVLAHMAEYEEYKAHPRTRVQVHCEEKRLPGWGAFLEPDVMRWLRENGMPTPEFGCATTEDEVVKVCSEIGYPVAMKVVSPDIIHKSELGGVRLDIGDDEVARQSFECIREAASGKDFRGVVIYPMVRSAQEVLLGISNDPQFGPVILFGMGGIYTEVLSDIALRVAPIDATEAEGMIREIRAFPILEGARGRPPCDLDALAGTLVKLSWLPFQYPEVAEIDLNPVFLFSKGLVVGDVRVIRKENRA
jgi:acetyl coenzyme A synthetase (ADP forming)-like protein